ncbi:diguanylate cyclase (GGDEF) domain-containing protein [Pseudomonas cuatrocienegasensis]|uniref:diguanylate cyclase n=1 Tax=Pseudomonas cuatrocienegasensis TaxID=543360 RepID=A0ABY1BEM7_9PSED|nr:MULTISPECIES: biofilm regulation diguanylate cyclase SiaD [Pseudomonas]SEQ67054.1 diguanylate cyclase (GGDEF) domain-containing protein [Pseudomonas cuatrocienegasensis]
MIRDRTALEERIASLLEAPAQAENPLYEPLSQLWEAHHDMMRRIDRISRISDAYQSIAKQREMSLAERLEKQLRQLEKVARISDRYQQMMHDLNKALRQASTHDALTGIANRRLLGERLKEEADRNKRYGRSFSIAMLDVDLFKRINDQHGHDVGDRMLVELASVLETEVREQDLCGRWGGEEFLILLPETDLDAAQQVIERVRERVRELTVRVDTELLMVTVSAGIAQQIPGESYSRTISRADLALLQAKRLGRDRCELASETAV